MKLKFLLKAMSTRATSMLTALSTLKFGIANLVISMLSLFFLDKLMPKKHIPYLTPLIVYIELGLKGFMYFNIFTLIFTILKFLPFLTLDQVGSFFATLWVKAVALYTDFTHFTISKILDGLEWFVGDLPKPEDKSGWGQDFINKTRAFRDFLGAYDEAQTPSTAPDVTSNGGGASVGGRIIESARSVLASNPTSLPSIDYWNIAYYTIFYVGLFAGSAAFIYFGWVHFSDITAAISSGAHTIWEFITSLFPRGGVPPYHLFIRLEGFHYVLL